MIHRFKNNHSTEGLHEFTDPFRYSPHPLVRTAASEVMARISSDPRLSKEFAEGKMIGVLVCAPAQTDALSEESSLCYIAAFSGNVSGSSHIEGFVPPIYDLTEPDGEFRKKEREISALNTEIGELEKSPVFLALIKQLSDAQANRDEELELMRTETSRSRQRRDEIRANCSDPSILAGLIKESQFEKAEMHRKKLSWERKIAEMRSHLDEYTEIIEEKKRLRAAMSETLQDWIFRQYIVHNISGEEASVAEIFSSKGLVPPGGTGECAAPKLLEYAFRNGLKPLAMGEFWYGKDSLTAVRTHGHFYPSCTSKCGPLLKFMLKGLPVKKENLPDEPCTIDIVYEDDAVIVIEKPSGMPSVPGLDGRRSALEILTDIYCSENGTIHSIHRLDMDTSGMMVFARTHEAAVELRRQFEARTIKKTYSARLSAGRMTENLKKNIKGVIDLPLSPDYDERPRQKVGLAQGKTAITEYESVSFNDDGTVDVTFRPITGRTHQLRVHSAHSSGLGCPIAGDLLYGGDEYPRLCLHAQSISFRHPVSGKNMQFTGNSKSY